MLNKAGQIKNVWRDLSPKNKEMLIAAAVSAVMVIGVKMQKTAVIARRGAAQLSRAMQVGVTVAGSKNQQAFSSFEAEFNSILAGQFPEIERQGQRAAEDLATFGSCNKIICSMVADKIKGTDATAQYVDGRMQAHLGSPLKKMSEDIETALRRFELELKENTVGLARELAQANPRHADKGIALPDGLQSNADIDQALKKLGINAIATGIVIPLDVWAVMNAKMIKSLVSKVATTAARMFARPAAAAAAEVTIAAADGPLPIGDIIAVIGGIFTVVDVCRTQKQFEREMKEATGNMMPDVRRDIQKQVMDHARAILKEHQRLQDEICQKSQQDCKRRRFL